MSILAEIKRPLKEFVCISSDSLQELVAQLIELSSKGEIRKTEDDRFSVLDIVSKVVEKTNASETWKRLCDKHPEVLASCDIYKFTGRRQRYTPVIDLAGIIEIIWLLPGEFSDKFRRIGAKVVSDAVTSKNTDSATASKALLDAVSQLTQLTLQQNKTIANLTTKLECVAEHQAFTNQVVAEYVSIRKFAEERLPGYIELTDAITHVQKALPPIIIHFTATEWVDEHAPHLSQRQRICFFKEIASAHRFLVGIMPEKAKGTFVYTNKHEILFERAKWVAENLIPIESIKPKPALKPFPVNDIRLTDSEQLLLGQVMKLTVLSEKIGYPVPISQSNDCSKLGIYVKHYVNQKLLNRPTHNSYYEVTPQLIYLVRQFHQQVKGA